jgi:hypothetical protein
MTRTIEVAATLLGLAVRGIWTLLLAAPQVVALGLIAYGAWLFDRRIAYIVVGLFLLVLSTPSTRPKDRRDK